MTASAKTFTRTLKRNKGNIERKWVKNEKESESEVKGNDCS